MIRLQWSLHIHISRKEVWCVSKLASGLNINPLALIEPAKSANLKDPGLGKSRSFKPEKSRVSGNCKAEMSELFAGNCLWANPFSNWVPWLEFTWSGPQPLQLGNLTRVYLTEGVAHLLFCGAHHGGNILGQVSQLLEHFHHLGWIQLIICLHPFSGIPGPSAVPWQSSY